jgi:hypothetical protein
MRDQRIQEKVLALIEEAMVQARVKIKKGAIVDATLVKGAALPNSKGKNGQDVDPDVHATARNGKPIYGYKVHVSTDTSYPFTKRLAALAIAFTLISARSFGFASVTSESIRFLVAFVIWITAIKGFLFAFDGLLKPLTFRTNWSAESRISSFVADSLS